MLSPAAFLDETKALACIHCGLCLGSCPTYLETGNENDSPRGRIYLMRALHSGRLGLSDDPVRHIDLCLGCRACEAACPSGVQYGSLLEHTREHIETHHRRSLLQRLLRRVAIEKVFPFPNRLRLALLLARLIRTLGLEKWLPAYAREALALLPGTFSAGELAESIPAEGQAHGRVGLISGCVMSAMFAETNGATVRLLQRAGWDIVIPRAQACCGALYAHGGRMDLARAAARRNIQAFEREKLDAIIVNAAGCGSTLKEYGALLAGEPEWAARARLFSEKVKDLSEWLVGSQSSAWAVSPNIPPGVKVTYHDACHLAHAQRITAAPRMLVKLVAGDAFVELPEADVCCGSAGTYNLTEPAMAARLQERKLQNILRSGARIVVTSNPGCLMQIQAALNKAGAPIRVMHLADFLIERTSQVTQVNSSGLSKVQIRKWQLGGSWGGGGVFYRCWQFVALVVARVPCQKACAPMRVFVNRFRLTRITPARE